MLTFFTMLDRETPAVVLSRIGSTLEKGPKPNEPAVTPENIQNLVNLTRNGHPESTEVLYSYFTQKFGYYFARRVEKDEAVDLTQVSAIKVIGHLSDFANDGRGNFYQNFHSWAFTIARNEFLGELRKRKRLEIHNDTFQEIPGDGQSSHYADLDLKSQLSEKVHQFLTQHLLKVVSLKLAGKNNEEIAAELAISEVSVRVALYRARKPIERRLIFPAGFKRVASFQNKKLMNATYQGSLEAVNFLGILYTTDEMVRRYRQRQKLIDQSLIAQGYQLLADLPPDYQTLLLPKYRHLVTKRDGRLYISPKNHTEFRQKRLKARKRRIAPPNPDYRRLVDFSKTYEQYKMVYNAAKNGKLKAIKHGHWWFTTQEAVDQFLQSKTKS